MDDWIWMRIGLNPGVGWWEADSYFTVILDLEFVTGLSLGGHYLILKIKNLFPEDHPGFTPTKFIIKFS